MLLGSCQELRNQARAGVFNYFLSILPGESKMFYEKAGVAELCALFAFQKVMGPLAIDCVLF